VTDTTTTPPTTRALTNYEIMQVQCWASFGISNEIIAVLLGMEPADFWYAAENDPRINHAIKMGQARGVETMAGVLFRSGANGEMTAVRFWLERLGGPQFRPARVAGPQVVIHNGPVVHIDQDAMAARFERQRKLVDGTADELKEC
jgi:hypothetical protein